MPDVAIEPSRVEGCPPEDPNEVITATQEIIYIVRDIYKSYELNSILLSAQNVTEVVQSLDDEPTPKNLNEGAKIKDHQKICFVSSDIFFSSKTGSALLLTNSQHLPHPYTPPPFFHQ